MLYVFILYYSIVFLLYATAAALYALNVQKVILIGKDVFPLLHSKERSLLDMTVRLALVAIGAGALIYSLIAGMTIGIIALIGISLWEVYLSWTFYKPVASEYMQLARLTWNTFIIAWCMAVLLL